MFTETLTALSHEQKTELYRRRVTPQLLSDWKHGRRLPTEVQVADLADVTGAPWETLQREIAVMRAPVHRRAEIARIVGLKRPNLLLGDSQQRDTYTAP
jgi:hypothetical protein